MKKQNVLVILIIVLSVLLFLTIGAIVYLVYRGNSTTIITNQVNSSVSSSKEAFNYNYVKLVDYKDKIEVKYPENKTKGYTIYITNLKKKPDYVFTFDMLLQKRTSEQAVLLLNGVGDDSDQDGVFNEVDNIRIGVVSSKYIGIDIPILSEMAVENIYSLETGNKVTSLEVYEIGTRYDFWNDYMVSLEYYEEKKWDTGVGNGYPSKLVLTNLKNTSEVKDLLLPGKYSAFEIKSISNDGILTYKIFTAIDLEHFNDGIGPTDIKSLDLNTVLNK